jgi:hypothetical protein
MQRFYVSSLNRSRLFFQSIATCPPPPRKRSSQSAGRRGKRDQRSGSVEPSASREKAGQGDGDSAPVKTASVAWLPANNFPTRDAGAPRSTASGMRLLADGAEEETMSGGSGDCSAQVSLE